MAAEKSWRMMRDGSAFRRAVPSPEPRRIREIGAIRLLVEAGALVICSGGGGIPVVARPDGSIGGVEAVIDKDLSAVLLAEQLAADALLLLTDVAAVSTRWGDPAARLIARASPSQLRSFHFAPGSMGPKVEAACRFVERTGGFAGIGAIEDASAILKGNAGTIVRHDVGRDAVSCLKRRARVAPLAACLGPRRSVGARALLLGERIDTHRFDAQEPFARAPLTISVREGGVAVLFRYGVIVLMNVSAEGEKALIERLSPLVIDPFEPPESEEARIDVSARGRGPDRHRWDDPGQRADAWKDCSSSPMFSRKA